MAYVSIKTTPEFRSVAFTLVQTSKTRPVVTRSFTSREAFEKYIRAHYTDLMWKRILGCVSPDDTLSHPIHISIQLNGELRLE